MEMGNTEHGAETEGPGVSEIKLVDLGKGAGIRSHAGLLIRHKAGRGKKGGREEEAPGDGSDLKPSAWY